MINPIVTMRCALAESDFMPSGPAAGQKMRHLGALASISCPDYHRLMVADNGI
jgi:hypothetical protein